MSQLEIILHGKAADDLEVRAAVKALRKDGHRVTVNVTWESGDAERMAARAVQQAQAGEPTVIVAGGGDGTINQVFSAGHAARPPEHCSFAILPLGTANDFAHSVNVPIADPVAALRLAATSPARRIDLGRLNKRVFVNLATGGFGSRVTAETDPTLKRHLGGLAYLLTGVARFTGSTSSAGRLRAEGLDFSGRFMALAIGNGRQAGGGIVLCPDALLDDGLLDIVILPELEASAQFEAVSLLLREGTAGIRPLCLHARSSWIEYEAEEPLFINLDGEPLRARRFRADCLPMALNVHVGDTPLLSGPAG